MEFASFTPTGAALTRRTIKIRHENALFERQVDGAHEAPGGREFHAVPLGLVRTRILWPMFDPPSSMGAPRRPLCVSGDLVHGLASPDFPLEEAGWPQMADAPDGGRSPLCETCEMRKFGQVGSVSTAPRCQLQWHVPLLLFPDYDSHAAGRSPWGQARYYTLTVTGSNVRAVEQYLIPFRDAGQPTYTHVGIFTLKRGRVANRAVAALSITRGEATAHRDRGHFSGLLHRARAELTDLRRPGGAAARPQFRGFDLGAGGA